MASVGDKVKVLSNKGDQSPRDGGPRCMTDDGVLTGHGGSWLHASTLKAVLEQGA